MKKLLRIDSSSRIIGSHSRDLSDYFVDHWHKRHSNSSIIVRDIVQNSIEHISQSTIEGFFTPSDALTPELSETLALSDELIAELQSADTLLLTAPIYNFSIPSALKAWIDHVVRIGHTFSYDGQNFHGLVKVKKAYVICVYGASGYLDGESFNAANYMEPYLKFLLTFLGIEHIEIISLQATTADMETVAANIEITKLHIENTINGNV